MYQQKWVISKQYVYLCSYLVLKWGIYWSPQAICALVCYLWIVCLVLRGDSHQLRGWPFHTVALTVLSALQDLVRKKIACLTYNQVVRAITVTYLTLQATESTPAWHFSFYSELCSSFLLLAFVCGLYFCSPKFRALSFWSVMNRRHEKFVLFCYFGKSCPFRVRPS